VFYDGRIKSPQEFKELLQKPSHVAVFFFEGLEPLGFAWLNSFSGNVAFGHFCGLREAVGRTSEIGREVLRYWMGNFTFLDVIFGLTPKNNRLAVKFIQRIVFTVLGDVPNVIYDAYAGERVPGVLSYFAR
jgi:hypothetical protein